MQHPEALAVLLRRPVLGNAKSRIAATTGDEKALEIYSELYSATLNLVAQLEIPVYLFYEGGLPENRSKIDRVRYHDQIPGDLAQKITQSLSIVFEAHEKVIIIGSDCPELSVDIITKAFHQLSDNDTVIGPATDGGFYLFGCKNLNPEILKDIHWSTSSVLEKLLENIQGLDYSYALLNQLSDIDTESDWEEYLARKANRV